MMKIIFAIFLVFSLIFVVNCAGQYYCSAGLSNTIFPRSGIKTVAFGVHGCFSAAYVRNTCDFSFHNSEATIASIPLRARRKRQALFGGSIANLFTSLLTGASPYQSGLTVPFTINQYVNSLPKNSIVYLMMTDARYADYGIPYCELGLLAPLRRHHAALGGREDIWYYYRADRSKIIIAFNKECPYSCLSN